MDEVAEELKHLVGVLGKYPGLFRNTYSGRFPKLRALERNKLTHIKIIAEQANKLLNHGSVEVQQYWRKDDARLMKVLVRDIQLFCTTHQIRMEYQVLASYGRERLSSKGLYSVARSEIYRESYRNIDLLTNKSDYDLFSVPFTIRLAIEEKIKGMIGFKHSDVTVGKGVIKGTSEFPLVQVLNVLKQLDCMDIPVNLEEIKDIYAWSCRFCHTARKEYIWMTLKALDTLYPLFDYDQHCRSEKPIQDIWGHPNQGEESVIAKLFAYKGFLKPLYYLKKDWTLSRLMGALNQSPLLVGRTLYLETTEFDEREGMYSSEYKKYF